MKSNINLTKLFPLIIAGLILIPSCSTYKMVDCPDLSNNRNYSKKYMASNRTKKNLHKNHTKKRDDYYGFKIYNSPRYKFRNAEDYTINQDISYIIETSEIKPTPGITEFQVPSGRDEKFDFIASSADPATNGSLVQYDPDIKNNDNNGQVAPAQNLSNFTKKEQQEFIKPFKKELKKADRSHVQAISEQQVKPAWGFSIGSIIFGLVGLFLAILGFLTISGFFLLGSAFLGLLSIILARIALRRIHMNPGLPGKRFAVAGLVLGLVDVITFLAIIIVSVAQFGD